MFYLIEFANTKEIRHTIDFGLEDNEIQRKFKDVIIKQSESVYDLIEVGDLIKDDDSIYEVDEITEDELEEDEEEREKMFISQPCYFVHFGREIDAIYKRDFKGNYILVWERKDYEQ